jgi:hypothetical protein
MSPTAEFSEFAPIVTWVQPGRILVQDGEWKIRARERPKGWRRIKIAPKPLVCEALGTEQRNFQKRQRSLHNGGRRGGRK